jgi:hypothetical protein
MAETNKVKVIDRGWNKLIKKFFGLKSSGKAVAVGFQGSEAEIESPEHGGLTNVELAAIHEFGTKNGRIPARPMIRQTFDKNQNKYDTEMKKISAKFFDPHNVSIDGELLMLGQDFRTDIIQAVVNDEFQPWADSTQLQKDKQGKAGDPPLWDTNQLVNSIRALVTDHLDTMRAA